MTEQTETKPKETLEFRMNEQMQTFSFNPPIISVEEGEWLLAVSSFDCTNIVFKIRNGTKAFQLPYQVIGIPNLLKKIIGELNKLLELRSENYIELHTEQVRNKLLF